MAVIVHCRLKDRKHQDRSSKCFSNEIQSLYIAESRIEPALCFGCSSLPREEKERAREGGRKGEVWEGEGGRDRLLVFLYCMTLSPGLDHSHGVLYILLSG